MIRYKSVWLHQTLLKSLLYKLFPCFREWNGQSYLPRPKWVVTDSLHNRPFMSRARQTRHFARIARGGIVIRARLAIRAKCRVRLIWLIKRQLCRLVTDSYERGNKALT